MSFQLNNTNNKIECMYSSHIFDIFIATKICQLNIKFTSENQYEQNIAEIIDSLLLTNSIPFPVTIDSLFQYIAQLSLQKTFSCSINALQHFIPPTIPIKIEILPSLVHGRGIFTTEIIEKDEIVTFYPVHSVQNTNSSLFHHELYYDYIYSVDDNITIAGHPNITDDLQFCGHLLNDGSLCLKNEEAYENTLENCSFLNIVDVDSICYCVAIIANKQIQKGEELFLSYGWPYWKTKQK